MKYTIITNFWARTVDPWGVDENYKLIWFDTHDAAEKEIEEFLEDINDQIRNGERDPEHGWDRDEFDIVNEHEIINTYGTTVEAIEQEWREANG
jgi:hypothetical protein